MYVLLRTMEVSDANGFVQKKKRNANGGDEER